MIKISSQNISYLLRFLFISFLGVFLHFAYDLSGQNPIVAAFSAVNESTWEHLKLFYYPMLLLTIFELLRFKKEFLTFLSARTLATISGLLFITIVFYTFWGFSGKLIDFINISIFFAGVLFAFTIEYLASARAPIFTLTTVLILWCTLLFAFIYFTYRPPALGLFYNLSLHPKG